MSAFEESRAYKIVAEDAAGGTLSHAYLLVCPDARNLRTFLKELAKLVIGADARAARLIGAEMYSDCRVFPAPEAKATVADVKELLDDCYIRPVEGGRKVFVLDNMQDMLAPAQNKLLKVLEEPPANVHFLLGTTNEFPVLPTVRSRAKKLELFSFPESAVEAHIRALYPARKDAREIAALSGGVLGRAEELASPKRERRRRSCSPRFRPRACPPRSGAAQTAHRRAGCSRSCACACATRSCAVWAKKN